MGMVIAGRPVAGATRWLLSPLYSSLARSMGARRVGPRRIEKRVEAGVIHRRREVRFERLTAFVLEVVGAWRIAVRRMHVEWPLGPAPKSVFDVPRVLARLENLGHVPDRGALTERSQVLSHVVPKTPAAHVRTLGGRKVEVELHDFSSQSLEIGHGPLEDTYDRGISVLGVHQRPEHAEPRALESIQVQERCVVVFLPASAVLGVRVGWIVSSNHVEDASDIFDGPPHRSCDVSIEAQRDDAVSARETDRRADPDEREVR